MSELALRLIGENKKTQATFLDSGKCGLASAPKEFEEPEGLEELSFSNKTQGAICLRSFY